MSTAAQKHGVPLAASGWALLTIAVVLLGLETTPHLLEALNTWVEPAVEPLRADLPVAPGVWLPACLLSLLGMGLVGWAGGGAGMISEFRSPLVIQTSPSVGATERPGRRRRLGFIAGLIPWLGVVWASAASVTHWPILLLWSVALAVFAIHWWRLDRAEGVSISLPRVKPSTWLLVPVVVAAFAVTLYRLSDVPNSIWGDEGAFWTLARDIASGARVNPFDLGAYAAFPMMSSLYQSLWIRLFGPTLWSWRLGSAVIGTLSIVPLFFMARKLLGSRIAWSATAVMVGMPYFLAYARVGFNSIQPLLPITVGLWLATEALPRRSTLLSYLSGMALGLASLTYMSGHVGLVVALLLWGFLYVKHGAVRPLVLKLIPALLMGWLSAAGPFLLGCLLGGKPCGAKVVESFMGSAFYGEAMFSLEEITRLHPLRQLGQHQIFFEPRIYAVLTARGLIRTAAALIQDGVATSHYLVGPLAGPLPVFFLAGLGWMLSKARHTPTMVWTAWIVVCGVSLSVLNTFPPRTAHLAPIIPALAVVTAVGVWLFVDLLRQLWATPLVEWVGIGLVAAMVALGLRDYFVTMPQRYVPDLENVMFWRAREMEPGSDLVFVADAPYSPDFEVWGIEQFNLEVDYEAVSVDDVDAVDWAAICDTECRVFFLPQSAGVVEAELRAQLGAGRIQEHRDAEGKTIGLEYVVAGE